MSFSSQSSVPKARSNSQTLSICLNIISASILVVLNPIVVGLYLDLEAMPTIFLLVFDFALAAIMVLCFLHLRTDRGLYLVASLIVVFCLPIVMGFVELMLTYIRLTYGDEWNGIQLQNVHKSDPLLGWVPIPNAKGRHRYLGNFDVIYEFDERGRKAIPQNEGITRTMHFFGDSFTFGFGVSNEDTALNILAERFRDQFNVLNYGVIGYGLEQMTVRLWTNLDEVKSGDVVIFSPLTTDIYRSSVNNALFCSILLASKHLIGAGGEPVRIFRNGEWDTSNIREHCNLLETLLLNSSGMPLGAIYQRYHKNMYNSVILDHATQVLAQAAQMVHQRDALFLLVILLTPGECETGELNPALHLLNMPFKSLASFCPENPNVLNSFRFPTDDHWSPRGNQWAANALEVILEPRL